MARCQAWALLFVGFAVSCCCALSSTQVVILSDEVVETHLRVHGRLVSPGVVLQSSSSAESCRVEVTLSPPWTTKPDNTTLVSVNLNIVNTGRIAIATPWVLTLLNSAYGTVQQVFTGRLLLCCTVSAVNTRSASRCGADTSLAFADVQLAAAEQHCWELQWASHQLLPNHPSKWWRGCSRPHHRGAQPHAPCLTRCAFMRYLNRVCTLVAVMPKETLINSLRSTDCLQVSSGTGKPSIAHVNGHNCTVTMAAPSPPTPPSSGAIESAGQLTTSNGQIIGLDGSNLYLIGLNYFGFDDGNTMIDGLWVGE